MPLEKTTVGKSGILKNYSREQSMLRAIIKIISVYYDDFIACEIMRAQIFAEILRHTQWA